MGHHNRHFAGDRYANAGVWGPPTSTANFCEEDYAVTLYIAEFINALTNAAYVYHAVRYPGGASWTRPDLFAVALWVLGFLSFGFHATLRHGAQYGDELAMLVLGGALLQGSWGPRSRAAGLVSWSTVAAASALYLRTGQILHQVYAFQAMLAAVGARTVFLIFCRQQAHPPRHYLARFAAALAALALAYFLWHVDLERCADLRRYRAALGLPLAWLLELHGWWHVLTALGASLYIRLLRELNQ